MPTEPLTSDRLTQQWVDKVMSQDGDDSPSADGAGCRLTQEEWRRRFAARIMACANWDERPAMQCAEAGYEIMVTDSPEFATDPEGAADEEMSCWTDDGDE